MPVVKRTAQPRTVMEDERKNPRDFAGLVNALADPDPVARRWAARDLAPFPEAAPALVAQLQREPEASVRQAILTSLTLIGDGTAVEGLITCLRSEDPALRNEALEAMKDLPEAVAPIMARLLADPDPDMRIFAVNVLEGLRHPQVEKWLIDVIQQDPHVNVCATAVDLLGELGTDAALKPLEELKCRFPHEPYIAFAVDLIRARIKGS